MRVELVDARRPVDEVNAEAMRLTQEGFALTGQNDYTLVYNKPESPEEAQVVVELHNKHMEYVRSVTK